MRALLIAAAIATGAAMAQEKVNVEALLKQAEQAEAQGDGRAAVKAYIGAARGGSAQAAWRLGEIYDKGLLGISRDYAESFKWFNHARTLGIKRDGGWGCPPKC